MREISNTQLQRLASSVKHIRQRACQLALSMHIKDGIVKDVLRLGDKPEDLYKALAQLRPNVTDYGHCENIIQAADQVKKKLATIRKGK